MNDVGSTRALVRRKKAGEKQRSRMNGYILLAVSGLFFVWTAFSLVGVKLLPETGHTFLDWLREDKYYALLIPCLIPVTVVAAYLNWLGLKLFRHN